MEGSDTKEKLGSTLPVGLLCLVVAAGFFLQSRTVADPDLWGHVKFGQDFWRGGVLAQMDPYSYLSGYQLWHNHEWLTEAVFALAYGVAGSTGLWLLKGAIVLLMMVLLALHLRRDGFGALIVLIFLVLLSVPWVTSIRPQIFTYFFFLLVLLSIHREESGRRGWIWAVPPSLALWANFHGGVLAGFGILGVWAVSRVGMVLWKERRPGGLVTSGGILPVITALAGGLAMLVNPYGIGLLEFLFRTATVPRPDISEWQPILIRSLYGGAYLLCLGTSIAGLMFSRGAKNPVLTVVWIISAILPLTAVRHTPLFALANAVLMGAHVNDAWGRYWGRTGLTGWGSHKGRLEKISLGAAFILILISLPQARCIRIDPARTIGFPARAVALLRESGAGGKLAIHFDWGEYAIWHLSPRFRVSMDGRRETVYAKQVYKEFLNFLYGTGDWDAHLRRDEADIALVPKSYPVFNLMRLKPGWELFYEDDLAGLFLRKGYGSAERLREVSPPRIPHDGRGICFP